MKLAISSSEIDHFYQNIISDEDIDIVVKFIVEYCYNNISLRLLSFIMNVEFSEFCDDICEKYGNRNLHIFRSNKESIEYNLFLRNRTTIKTSLKQLNLFKLLVEHNILHQIVNMDKDKLEQIVNKSKLYEFPAVYFFTLRCIYKLKKIEQN